MIFRTRRKSYSRSAKALAEGEYEKYRIMHDQIHESDFDKLIKESKAHKTDLGEVGQ